MNDMAMFDTLFLIFGIVAIGMGIYEIATKKLFGKRNDEYTKESVIAFAPIDGGCDIAIGLGGVLTSLAQELNVLPYYFNYPGLALVVIGLIVEIIFSKKTLVPKKKNFNVKKP